MLSAKERLGSRQLRVLLELRYLLWKRSLMALLGRSSQYKIWGFFAILLLGIALMGLYIIADAYTRNHFQNIEFSQIVNSNLPSLNQALRYTIYADIPDLSARSFTLLLSFVLLATVFLRLSFWQTHEAFLNRDWPQALPVSPDSLLFSRFIASSLNLEGLSFFVGTLFYCLALARNFTWPAALALTVLLVLLMQTLVAGLSLALEIVVERIRNQSSKWLLRSGLGFAGFLMWSMSLQLLSVDPPWLLHIASDAAEVLDMLPPALALRLILHSQYGLLQNGLGLVLYLVFSYGAAFCALHWSIRYPVQITERQTHRSYSKCQNLLLAIPLHPWLRRSITLEMRSPAWLLPYLLSPIVLSLASRTLKPGNFASEQMQNLPLFSGFFVSLMLLWQGLWPVLLREGTALWQIVSSPENLGGLLLRSLLLWIVISGSVNIAFSLCLAQALSVPFFVDWWLLLRLLLMLPVMGLFVLSSAVFAYEFRLQKFLSKYRLLSQNLIFLCSICGMLGALQLSLSYYILFLILASGAGFCFWHSAKCRLPLLLERH